MQIFKGVKELLAAQPQGLSSSVVTIGNFDGVHRGHQKLLAQLKLQGKRFKSPFVVMTFDPHPGQVLYPEKNIFRLFPLDDQDEQLKLQGVDFLIREPFNMDLAQTPAPEFFTRFLLNPLHPKAIVVGHDFRFGQNRLGDFSMLQALCKEKGIEAERVEAYQLDGQVVSSSKIRELLSKTDLNAVLEFLGRNYSVTGEVQHGDGRGDKLGFPTANIAAPAGLPLPNGVYVTAIHCGSESHHAVTNVGRNPTFEDPLRATRIESFILNFNGSLYGDKIKVEFLKFLRIEKKFKDAKELIEQINEDVKQAKEFWHGRN